MKNSVLLVLVVFLAAGIATGQGAKAVHEKMERKSDSKVVRKPAVRARPEPPIEFSMMQDAASVIMAERPEVSEQTLSYDAEMIEDSLPAIQVAVSKKGFTQSDARDATLYAWQELRIKKLETTAVLSAAELMRFVNGLGKLTIRTTPKGASIKIDGVPAKDAYGREVKTQSCRWPSAGHHRITLILDGYETVDEDCVIDEDGEVVFERTLKPIAKKPQQ